MNPKKILVVYFSKSGKTRIIANEISQKLQCRIEEIKTTNSYSGITGYPLALTQSIFNLTPPIKAIKSSIPQYDLIIIGGPIWAGSISAPVRSFITKYRKDFKKVAFFATQDGQFGKKRLFEQMKSASKKTPLAVLDITEKDFETGKYKNNISAFIARLNMSNPKIAQKRSVSVEGPHAVM